MNEQLAALRQNLNQAIEKVIEAPNNETLNRLDVLTDELIQESMRLRIDLRKTNESSTKFAGVKP